MVTKAVRGDTFPAEMLTDPDAPDPADRRRVYPVRVLVTLDEVIVFADGPRPTVVFRDALASYSPHKPVHRMTSAERKAPGAEWNLATTDSGHALTWRRAGGCGCGSRLKVLSVRALTEIADAAAGDSQGMATAAARGDR